MTKITEASNLGKLGVPDNLVGKIAQAYKLKHDEEFNTLKTKGEMKANLKNGKLIIGISPDGKIASLGKEGGWGAGKSVKLTVDGSQEWANTITDALNLVPGRGWKWFASESSSAGESRPDKWQQKYHKQRDEADDTLIAFSRLLDKVYEKKISSDAKEYAQDVRDHVIQILDRSADVDMHPEDHRNRDDNSDLRAAHDNFKLLHFIANSGDPFLQIAKQAHTGHFGVHRISQYLENKIERYDGYGTNEETVAIFLRNEPLAAQKIVQHFSNELRKLRDDAIGAKGDAKLSNRKALPKVKKAWESYKADGSVKKL